MSTQISVLSSMATRQVLAEMAAHFEREHGIHLLLESVGGLDAARRVERGEPLDAVVLAADAIDRLIARGAILPGSRVDLARSGVAVAVQAGARRPDIGSEAALRQAVLDAETLGVSTGPSGVALASLFERWDIAPAIRERIVQAPPGVPVARLLAEGKVALGFQQLAEMKDFPGIDVLGPLPEAIQIITSFSGGVASTSAQPDAVHDMLAYMASPALDEIKRRQGMAPA